MCALLTTALLAGCGGDSEQEPAARESPAPAETQAPADAEAAVKKTFDEYNQALADRDWEAACDRLAPETSEKLRENVKKLGLKDPPQDCDELLGKVYETADQDPQQKDLLDEIINSAKVNSIDVQGETATINWSAKVQGQNTPIAQTARLIDGEWKLVDVTN